MVRSVDCVETKAHGPDARRDGAVVYREVPP